MIIDNHTHIYNEKTYQEYFEKTKDKVSKALVMGYFNDELPYGDPKNYYFEKVLEFVEQKENLFMAGSINMEKDIGRQVKNLEKFFQEKKIYGIKLYPGYQYFYSSDEKIGLIAELCQKYDKPLIFHTGDVYNLEGDAILKYSHPIYIDELAVKFPKCRIVISHFGFPYLLEAANVVSKNENVFVDISGTLDKSETDGEDRKMMEQYTKDLQRVLNYFPNIKSKIMFGTDFAGNHTTLSLVEPYISVVKNTFSKDEQEKVFHSLAEKVYGV